MSYNLKILDFPLILSAPSFLICEREHACEGAWERMPTPYSMCTAHASCLVLHQLSEAGWAGPVAHPTDGKIHEGSMELCVAE